jgi:hypothetical protein
MPLGWQLRRLHSLPDSSWKEKVTANVEEEAKKSFLLLLKIVDVIKRTTFFFI